MPSAIPIRGLRHLALNATDLPKSLAFYQKFFQMKVVWQPDADNVYLSSGVDNLALHQIPQDEIESYQNRNGQFLDHLGFLMDSPASVDQLFEVVQAEGVRIVHLPKQHRDGSYSFYLADPDNLTVQVIYEPTISRLGHTE
ncbi:MAG: VOC family protein [Nitrospirae bacterium]|nr:VOC family protein [Nitrospirota bacterium]